MATTTEDAGPPGPAGGDPMRPAPFRVARRVVETHDVFTLWLEPVGGPGGFSSQPGQFDMLYAFGAGEVPVSLSGPPGPVKQVVHTIRAVGPVTQSLQRLKRGDVVGLRGPFGSAWPVSLAEGSDVVLVAGGIGLAPLRPALYHVLSQRERYGRIVLLYGARTPRDILFAREIETWRGRFDADVEVVVDRAAPGWHGLVGVVTTLVPRAHFDPHNAVAFVCGPELMMTFTVRALAHHGVVPARTWVSLERNMKCAVGFCGHCQLGPTFICRDGPVYRWDRVAPLLGVREL
ncbi:MAG: FAD/NAD(P)-binding protein [Candidatus Eisenbacteria bacterium]|nr:FAD/NAD(P)-binding protein [Candidatus Eisenbacteria bacterium]